MILVPLRVFGHAADLEDEIKSFLAGQIEYVAVMPCDALPPDYIAIPEGSDVILMAPNLHERLHSMADAVPNGFQRAELN